MKKLSFIMAIAAFALGACSPQNEQPTPLEIAN